MRSSLVCTRVPSALGVDYMLTESRAAMPAESVEAVRLQLQGERLGAKREATEPHLEVRRFGIEKRQKRMDTM
eukprot:6193127-Pleurochrysis_carterae.AAC.2